LSGDAARTGCEECAAYEKHRKPRCHERSMPVPVARAQRGIAPPPLDVRSYAALQVC
jgi:hypothetical protein